MCGGGDGGFGIAGTSPRHRMGLAGFLKKHRKISGSSNSIFWKLWLESWEAVMAALGWLGDIKAAL
jgi:hypothetical protein